MDEIETIIAKAMNASKAWPAVFEAGSAAELARAVTAALDAAGFAVVPKEPSRGLLISMAIRSNHAFLVKPQEFPNGVRTSGTRPEHREGFLSQMRQLHEEVVGTGFWSPERDAEYVESFQRAMIDARPK